jgi:hypothetical protein
MGTSTPVPHSPVALEGTRCIAQWLPSAKRWGDDRLLPFTTPKSKGGGHDRLPPFAQTYYVYIYIYIHIELCLVFLTKRGGGIRLHPPPPHGVGGHAGDGSPPLSTYNNICLHWGGCHLTVPLGIDREWADIRQRVGALTAHLHLPLRSQRVGAMAAYSHLPKHIMHIYRDIYTYIYIYIYNYYFLIYNLYIYV